ncbi:hypothetical protein DOTSEDRAFT_29698 [Dothistroma septosporum NZE10]|uniref:Uncharacterized protein n=1 Tax=Dothistroma septosporum (strain NZE10 / CBS 128990) TaxID=675120 RepID=M2WHM8_DOTSN|nr:hypothetical protein DOTSEDRAFT_29698 [Dothistroma septosporum NZE10]
MFSDEFTELSYKPAAAPLRPKPFERRWNYCIFCQRWGSGRSKDWDLIDSPAPSAAQQQIVAQVDQEITAAAALSRGINYLTNMVNSPILLRAPGRAYVSAGRPQAPAMIPGSIIPRSSRKVRVRTGGSIDGEDEVEYQDKDKSDGYEDEDDETSDTPAASLTATTHQGPLAPARRQD